MTVAEALTTAQAAGIRLAVDGSDLVLRASAPPPDAVVELLARHKPALLAYLRSEADREWLEERAAVMQFDGGLSAAQAEAEARRLLERLARNARSAA